MHQGPDIAPAIGMMFVLFAAFIGLIVTVITILAFCKIFSKAGYSWAFGLLALVPFGGLIMILILAFSDWPICREIRSLKSQTPGR